MSRTFARLALWGAGLFWPIAAGGTVLSSWSLEEVAARADRVVVGVVASKRTVREGNELFTENTIRVERTLLGSDEPDLTLWQLGGKEGDREVELVGDVRLRVGERYVLFTRAHADTRRYLVGMALGAFSLQGERGVQTIEVPLITSEGKLLPSPGERVVHLDQIIEAIRLRGPGPTGRK